MADPNRLAPIVHLAVVESANGDAEAAKYRRCRDALDRSEAARRTALWLLDGADPAAGPGTIAVLFGQLRLLLGRSSDEALTPAEIGRMWLALGGDAALAELSRQAPGTPG